MDAVESTEALRGGVGEEPAVKHDDAAEQEETQEHGDGEEHVDRHRDDMGFLISTGIIVNLVGEVMKAWRWMDSVYQELYGNA